MALRAVPDHPKFADLKARLKRPKCTVLGCLEGIWHFSGRFTPQGNIGKYSDEAIESWVEWDGEPGALIGALVKSHWLDRSEAYRLVVHDWKQHCDAATKIALKRAGLTFCSDSVTTVSRQCSDSVTTVSRQCSDSVLTVSSLPEPEPEPEPGAGAGPEAENARCGALSPLAAATDAGLSFKPSEGVLGRVAYSAEQETKEGPLPGRQGASREAVGPVIADDLGWGADSEENIPDDLPDINMGNFLLETLSIPHSFSLAKKFADAARYISKDEGCTRGEAAKRILRRARDNPPRDGKWAFWVQDGGWKERAEQGVSTEGWDD